MKLPKESTLWNWAFIGLGLIIGVAVIGLMNFLNEYLHLVQGNSANIIESDVQPVSNKVVYFTGKIISIVSGGFTTGAIIKMARPQIKTVSLLFVGSVFMMLSFIDLFMYTYPIWYQVFSIIVTLPSVFMGYRLIK